MCRYYESCMLEYPKMDYESAMMAVSKNEKKLYCLNVGDTPWCEIDNLEHYQRAINEIYPRIIQIENKAHRLQFYINMSQWFNLS